MELPLTEHKSMKIVNSVELEVCDQPHPYHLANDEIAMVAWQKEVEKVPSLFNGNVTLESDFQYVDGKLKGKSYFVPYSTFLHWLQNENAEGNHLFAIGLIISSDGLPILGRMAENTYNAGKTYAPSGSLDEDDVKGGMIDINGNMARELHEETQLSLSDAVVESNFHIFSHGRKTTAVKRCVFDKTAVELCDSINEFIARDNDAELSEVFAIKNKGEYDADMASYMAQILNWYFDQQTK